MKKLVTVLVLTTALTTSCGSDGAEVDCGDARKVAQKHKSAAQDAVDQQTAVLDAEGQPVDPVNAEPNPLPSFLADVDALNASQVAGTEARLYFAVVKGNPTCFGAEERAQVDVGNLKLSSG